MVIFHSYVSLPEGKSPIFCDETPILLRIGDFTASPGAFAVPLEVRHALPGPFASQPGVPWKTHSHPRSPIEWEYSWKVPSLEVLKKSVE